MRSFSDAHNALNMINKISKLVLKNELAQDMTRNFEMENGRALGHHLATELLADVATEFARVHNLNLGDEPLSVSSDLVIRAFREKNQDIKMSYQSFTEAGGVDHTNGEKLKNEGRAYRKIQSLVVDAYRDMQEVDSETARCSELLTTKSRELKLDFDPNSPAGLRSAKLLVNALRDYETFATYGTDGPRKRMEKTLDQLRGFDLETMRRPWHQKMKAAFGGGEKLDLGAMSNEKREELRQIAEAIIYIREDAPKLRELARADVESYSGLLDELSATRRRANPDAIRQVTDMVRIAVLYEWKSKKSDYEAAGGRLKEGFNPAGLDVREKIEATLKTWGMDLDLFAPEIDEALHSRITPDDLIQWASDAKWSDATLERYRAEHPKLLSTDTVAAAFKSVLHSFTLDGNLHRKAMDDETRKSLISILSAFQEGDKLDLKAGQKISLDTGKLPVEPTGLAGLKAKLSGSHIGQFEVERGSDGIKLHLRSGLAGTLGLDVIVGKKFDSKSSILPKGIEGRAEFVGGVEGGGGKLTGVSISFKNDESGIRNLVDLVEKMIDGEKAKIGDLKGATDVGRGSETRTRFGTSAQGTGRLAIGGKGPKVSGKEDTLGLGVSGQIGLGISRSTKGNVAKSNNETTYKSEVEYALTLNAGLNVFANIYNPVNMATGNISGISGGQQAANNSLGKDKEGKGLYDMTSNTQSTDVAGINGSTTVSFTDKTKQVSDPSGFFTKAERVRQSNVVQSKWESFAVCGKQVEDLLVKEENREFAKNFQALMKLAKAGDFVQVTYALAKSDMERANEYVRFARLARAQGNEEMAQTYERRARFVVDNGKYVPEKIAVVKTSVQKSEISNFNARWIRWDTVAEGKSEHTEVTIKFPT